jgi:hypothetical protein
MKQPSQKEQEDIENKIIDLIGEGAGERLIIFKPKENLESVDLVVKKRGEYKKKETEDIFLKINSLVSPGDKDDFIFDVFQDKFEPSKNLYLMFVCFNEVDRNASNIWVIPSIAFRDIADSIKSSDGKTIFKFETKISLDNKDKYTKFLINTEDVGKLLLEIVESNGKYQFSESGFRENRIVNLEILKKVVIEARENTYALDSKSSDNPRILGSIQLEYQKTDYYYQFIYFRGKTHFSGQEIVYQNNRPIWTVNYFGSAISGEAEEFLKKFLLEFSGQCRFGENYETEKRSYKYQNIGHGSIEEFFGVEKMFFNNEEIFKTTYCGGIVSR